MKVRTTALSLSMLIAIPALAAEIYVNGDTGVDSPSNGSYANPLKTIQAGAERLSAGDTLYIAGDQTYNETDIQLRNILGSSSQVTTITSYGTGRAQLQGSGPVHDWDLREHGVDIRDCSWIRVENLKFFKINGQAIRLYDSPNCEVVENITINTGGSGIYARRCNDLTISHNTVDKAVQVFWNECITVAESEDVSVHHNTIRNRVKTPHPDGDGGEGIDLKTGCKNAFIYNNKVLDVERMNVYVDGWDRNAYNFDIYNNYCRSGGVGFSIAQENGSNGTETSDVWIFNNIVYGSKSGIYFAGNGIGSEHNVRNVNVHFNTVHSCDGGFAAVNPDLTSSLNTFNIYSDCSVTRLKDEYNVFGKWLNIVTGSGTLLNAGNYTAQDPLFVGGPDYDPGRFKLQASSPAIDQISGSGASRITVDFSEKTRGSLRDIGAFEY